MFNEFCPDCEEYPSHVVTSEVNNKGVMVKCHECRDCGFYWEEGDPSQDFFENTFGGIDLDDGIE